MSARPLIAGNWKMNLLRAEAVGLAEALAAFMRDDRGIDMSVFPAAPLLGPVAAALAGSAVACGGQDCHAEAAGAHTGDISAAMLRDAGCSQVILGHSERRAGHDESDGDVRAKAEAARAAGLTAIVCVGETAAERAAGEAAAVVERQLRGSLPAGAGPGNAVIAYEPVWAIGAGQTASLADIADMHGRIREVLQTIAADGAAMRILYGGSVKPDNAGDICRLEDVDGALVGGASLNVGDFRAIAMAASP